MISYMKALLILFVSVLFLSSSWAQQVEVYDSYDEFEAELIQNSDKTYVCLLYTSDAADE